MAPPARAEAIPPAIAPNIITSLKWLETNNLFNNLIQRNQSAAFSSGKVRPNHETNINIIARRTGKDVNSHTVLDGIITTIMATIQRINIIGRSEERFSRNAETDLVCRLLLEKKKKLLKSTEVIKLILGEDEPIIRRLLMYDAPAAPGHEMRDNARLSLLQRFGM